MEAGIGFDDNNYLWDLGLIFWYRRVKPEEPLPETIEGPCGMRLHERLLLPNYGRDGAAFFDHVLEVYDEPPKSIVFLHGHAAISWHSSCESVFARTSYVYRDLASGNQDELNKKNNTVQNHIMTLTSSESETRNFTLDWYGGAIVEDSDSNDVDVNRRRLLSSDITANQTKTPCELFKKRWHEQVFSRIPAPSFMSCCASFVLPGERIRRYPRAFYEDLKYVLMDTDERYDDQGRECFEFLVYWLFGDEPKQLTREDLQIFYDEADGLVHGKNGSALTRLFCVE